MAIILVLLGGMLGFASAVVSLLMFNATFLHALALWSGMGCTFVLAALILSALPRRPAVAKAGTSQLVQNT